MAHNQDPNAWLDKIQRKRLQLIWKPIKSGSVSMKTERYYISVLIEESETSKPVLNNFGIDIYLGLKDFTICSIWKNL